MSTTTKDNTIHASFNVIIVYLNTPHNIHRVHRITTTTHYNITIECLILVKVIFM